MRGSKAFFKPQTETKLAKFTGRDLDVYAESFLRFLWSTRQEDLDERAKVDLVINGCGNQDMKEVVSVALKQSDAWVRFLITLEKLYPCYVTDLELIQEIKCIRRMKEYPTTADIAQNVQTFTKLTDQLATSYYNDFKALLHFLPRVPPKAMDEIRATPERWSMMHTFKSVADLLYELALQRKSDATLKNLHAMAQVKRLDGNDNVNANANKDQEEAFATHCVRSALWPFNKHEDRDKATATMVVVVMALEVVVVAQVKAKDMVLGKASRRGELSTAQVLCHRVLPQLRDKRQRARQGVAGEP